MLYSIFISLFHLRSFDFIEMNSMCKFNLSERFETNWKVWLLRDKGVVRLSRIRCVGLAEKSTKFTCTEYDDVNFNFSAISKCDAILRELLNGAHSNHIVCKCMSRFVCVMAENDGLSEFRYCINQVDTRWASTNTTNTFICISPNILLFFLIV